MATTSASCGRTDTSRASATKESTVGTIIVRLALALMIAMNFLIGGEVVDQIKVSCHVVTDGDGYAQGIRTNVVNCRPDHAVAILLHDDAGEMTMLQMFDATGMPVSADVAKKPEVNPPNRSALPPPRHMVIPPLSGASFYIPVPRETKNVTVAGAPLIPTPAGDYRITCRPIISYVELAKGTDSVTLDRAHPTQYRFYPLKPIDLTAKLDHQKMAEDWIQKWAE